MIKILIADDHPLIREGFKKLINSEPDMQVVGEAGNAIEVLNFLKSNGCDFIVLDIGMPGRNGFDLLHDLQKHYSHIKVLILSMHPEEQFAVRALKAGASGYITKESAVDELVNAIRKIYRSNKYIDPEFAERYILQTTTEKKLPHERLSDREFQVFRLIAVGKSLQEIADELFLSIKTISTYRRRILDKMDLKSNADIIHYAYKNKQI